MKVLDTIQSPEDLKNLSIRNLVLLADDIRHALLEKISVTGGHFGPNFGMVEATIALHYVFSSPRDKIVYDVSHQSYVHKILTGRKEAYLNPERYHEVTGYSEPKESEHDLFTIGHTSTSVSMACGLAKARDLRGGGENVIAVIGDGSLSGGEAFEGLSCGAALKSNLIILLNDNNMSISDVNGGLYTHLTELRNTRGKSANNLFKALGYDYCFVEDGNDVAAMIAALEAVKDTPRPTVVHCHTRKGKGYAPAETHREDWHWFPPFHPESGERRRKMQGENYDNLVADYLVDKMQRDRSVVALVAAVPATIGFDEAHRKAAGEQFVDVDICEQHLLSMAAGITKNGGKPVVATFSTFYQRAYDQIAQDICINKCPVTILIRNGSIWAGNDVTHLGWFDLSLFSNIPNLVFLCPTNCEEYFAMLDWSIEQNEYPVCIRIPRNGVHHATSAVEKDYSDLNRFLVTRKGKRVAVIALGDFYQLGEEVVAMLREVAGVEATLINPRYASGLDEELLTELQQEHELVITLEDSISDGGFGQKIASFYGDSKMRVQNYGLKKEFLDGYNAAETLKQYGITPEQIISQACKSLGIA